jgi:AcrR family transcriptional regulator
MVNMRKSQSCNEDGEWRGSIWRAEQRSGARSGPEHGRRSTFYYHFQSMEELAAAVGEKLGESFDELLAPARLSLSDPIARLSFAFTQFLEKAIADPVWARLVVQSAQVPTEFARSVRAHLMTDLNEAGAQGRLTVQDVELAADIVMGIWLQVTRGTIQRRATPDLAGQALDAVLRALGASPARE